MRKSCFRRPSLTKTVEFAKISTCLSSRRRQSRRFFVSWSWNLMRSRNHWIWSWTSTELRSRDRSLIGSKNSSRTTSWKTTSRRETTRTRMNSGEVNPPSSRETIRSSSSISRTHPVQTSLSWKMARSFKTKRPNKMLNDQQTTINLYIYI